MIDQKVISDVVKRFVSSPKPPAPFTVKIDVPKDHPGLPRLVEATTRLPDVEVTQASGVRTHKQGLIVPGALEEFFDALGAVVGNDMCDEIKEKLGARDAFSSADPRALADLFQATSKILPLGLLKGMAQPR
jgi:hypothetical protein